MRQLISVPALIACLLLTPAVQAADEPTAGDLWKETKILTAYLLDIQLNPFDIEVAVRGENAYLTGTLPSSEEKALAGRIARSVEGITNVDNKIVIDEKVPQNAARYDADKVGTDANITAMVRTQLLWNTLTHAHDVRVSTHDGVVKLSGTVPDESVADEMIRIAQNTRLVEKVDSQLKIAIDDEKHAGN